ncbi:MAG: bifunctional phosphopantothenoylcysteine decarboxylase/phosphopantothenate--cysteine ligase CoaBC, partial [Geovibrio sp.]|nr:bifunctional phosphopantothenoylcysteine decarboxylase/phosphopantothenate--cysteine ligase CoaBC [Geovibrio sp.]
MANILIGVSGGIACYKVPTLCRLFKKEGHDVKVILTENASKFVTPLTFESVTGNRAYTGEFDPGLDPEIIEHIDLAGWADKFIIAPATANLVAKAACGIA